MASPQERRMVVIPVRFHRFTHKLAKYWSLYITYVAFGPFGVARDGDGGPFESMARSLPFPTIALQPPSLYQLFYLFGEQTLLSGQISFCQGRKRFLHCDLLTFVGPTTEISD